MATITGKPNLFFVTSPRTPSKMREEIPILIDEFSGQRWIGNAALQAKVFQAVSRGEGFEGSLGGELDLKARDRFTRGPKAFGLIDLDPVIALTDAGHAYLYGPRPHEAFLRQLIKFQLPSPYHVDKKGSFWVRPFLELLRLIVELGGLTKDEIAAFVMQLTSIDKYDTVKNKITKFRRRIASHDHSKSSYKRLFANEFSRQVREMYRRPIAQGKVRTRQSRRADLKSFLATKMRNHMDYADAAIRYLRESRLVSIGGGRSNRVYVPTDKLADVQFILLKTQREPVSVDNKRDYKAYLFNADCPALMTDDRNELLQSISAIQPSEGARLHELALGELKEMHDRLIVQRATARLDEQRLKLATYAAFSDIHDTYDDILHNDVLDAPLFMEWNTWRALEMLDDGSIQPNLRFDDEGMPLVTAPGGKPDILCQYASFDLIVEVTLASGQRQYEAESEPVARHVGNHQKTNPKPTYCLFIARQVNAATLSHFYIMHKYPVEFYGGTAKIIPIGIQDFRLMLRRAHEATTKPSADTILRFLEHACSLACTSPTEQAWYSEIRTLVDRWMTLT